MSEPKFNTAERRAAFAAVIISALGATGCDAAVNYDFRPTEEAATLVVCDGAAMRNGPHTNHISNPFSDGNVVATIKFGNAPEDTCLDTGITDVKTASGYDNNGMWYCVPEGKLAKFFRNTTLHPYSTALLCINWTHAYLKSNETKE